jgi:hypothetical protein
MKHIKVPVVASEPYGVYSTLFDAGGKALLIGVPIDWCWEIEIALNAYDDLIAQRDALVAALEGIRAVMDHLYTCADCSTWGLCEDVNVLIARAKHLQQGIYAPELVRGEGEQ